MDPWRDFTDAPPRHAPVHRPPAGSGHTSGGAPRPQSAWAPGGGAAAGTVPRASAWGAAAAAAGSKPFAKLYSGSAGGAYEPLFGGSGRASGSSWVEEGSAPSSMQPGLSAAATGEPAAQHASAAARIPASGRENGSAGAPAAQPKPWQPQWAAHWSPPRAAATEGTASAHGDGPPQEAAAKPAKVRCIASNALSLSSCICVLPNSVVHCGAQRCRRRDPFSTLPACENLFSPFF